MDQPGPGEGSATQDRLRQVKSRLRRSGAFLLAVRRRHEVVDAVSLAKSDEEAAGAVSELLEIDGDLAAEVVDMPVKAFTHERLEARERETERLEQAVTTLQGESS